MTYTSKYTILKGVGKYNESSKTEFIKKIDFEGKTYYGLEIYHDSDKL